MNHIWVNLFFFPLPNYLVPIFKPFPIAEVNVSESMCDVTLMCAFHAEMFFPWLLLLLFAGVPGIPRVFGIVVIVFSMLFFYM